MASPIKGHPVKRKYLSLAKYIIFRRVRSRRQLQHEYLRLIICGSRDYQTTDRRLVWKADYPVTPYTAEIGLTKYFVKSPVIEIMRAFSTFWRRAISSCPMSFYGYTDWCLR